MTWENSRRGSGTDVDLRGGDHSMFFAKNWGSITVLLLSRLVSSRLAFVSLSLPVSSACGHHGTAASKALLSRRGRRERETRLGGVFTVCNRQRPNPACQALAVAEEKKSCNAIPHTMG